MTSGRISAINAPRNSGPIALISNSIQLHIIPATAEWQRTRLAFILSQLQGPAPSLFNPSPERNRAIADLRFLGTPAAIELMADNLRDDRPELSFQCSFGLIGLPDSARRAALDALNRRIEDPNFPVSTQFLTALITIQLDRSPQHPGDQRTHLYAATWQSTLQAASRKEGTARALTLNTLIGLCAYRNFSAN